MLETLQGQVAPVAIAASAVLLLRAFYAEFESKWPENYFGGDHGVDPVVSRTPARFLLFRLGPVLAVLVVAGVVASRLDESRQMVIGYATVLHLAAGPVPGVIRSLRVSPPKIGMAAYRVGALMVVLLAAGLALLMDDKADRFVPSAEEFASAIWVGVAVVALSRFARSLTARQPATAELVSRAEAEVDPDLVRRLRPDGDVRAPAYLAIAYAEHLNRPPWVRRVERIMIRRGGSYGLMQMTSPTPLSDEQSVDLFLNRVANYPQLSEEPDWHELRTFFLAHNDDAAFADLATTLYWELRAA